MAFTAPATAPARTLAPILFAVFFTPRGLALVLRDFPLPPDAFRFETPPERPLARAFPLDRAVPLFFRERALPLRLVVFLAAIIFSWFSTSARL